LGISRWSPYQKKAQAKAIEFKNENDFLKNILNILDHKSKQQKAD